ncbi:MAG: M14 family metallopeptidase [Desulfobacter sp.]
MTPHAVNFALNLGCLSAGTPLFSDNDGDGYPEKQHIALAVSPGMDSGPVWAGLINLAARLNMESCGPGIAQPVVRTTPASGTLLVKKTLARAAQAACLKNSGRDRWQLSGNSPAAMQQILETLAIAEITRDNPRVIRLELYEPGSRDCRVWCDDGTEFRCELPALLPAPQHHPVKARRLPDLLDPAAMFLPAADKNPRGTRLGLCLTLPATLSPACGRALFCLAGAAASRATELTLPLARTGRSHNGLCLGIRERQEPGASIRQENGVLRAAGNPKDLAALIRETARFWFEADTPGGSTITAWKQRLKNAAGMITEQKPGGTVPVKTHVTRTIVRQMTLKGEAERLLARAARIPEGRGQICCRAFIGGNYTRRMAFRRQLDRLLTAKGYTPDTVVLRTHKPGVSWLLEEVEPALPQNTRSLCIRVRPFNRPGQMESRARWIQEMYPAPDVICKRRGWQTSQVSMVMAPGQDHDYHVTAYDAQGLLAGEFTLSPMVSALPYMLDKQKGQTSHPVSAGCEISKQGRSIWSCSLPTDRELVWKRFQEKWLVDMETAMNQMLPGLTASGALAFWEEIRIDVAIDEAQESAGLAQERIAPMEALHEDFYFGLLDFMEAYREARCPGSRIQLGRIMPMVRPANGGRPGAKLRLTPLRRQLYPPLPLPPTQCISYARGMLMLDISCNDMPANPEESERRCAAARARGYGIMRHGRGLRFHARPARRSPLPAPETPVTAPAPGDIPTGDTVRTWIRTLSGQRDMTVWNAGRTLMGRDIPAVEAATGHMTAQRARLLKPTLLVNARHHANEVSGTNAAMMLLHTLACDAKGRKILARANVVVVPLENGDGVATLEEMLPECPDHKLHAARYNALGMEWYDQYFQKDTPFTEARAKTRLFDRWLPGYMIDLHGVPSHEWEQPFAGYINPRFREHWIPRSFVYAILPFYGRSGHPGEEEAATLARKMSDVLGADPETAGINRQIFDRYQRYAKAFEPDVFDSDMQGSLVVVPTCERIKKTNFADRKWPLVRSEIITEVLDEVARGPWLERCTRAHLSVIYALLDHMDQTGRVALVRRETPDGICVAWQQELREDQGAVRSSR